ncbi:MAG: PQQ-dependent sugar dehydrogenase, partial [Gammaproteobacteria bacterium]
HRDTASFKATPFLDLGTKISTGFEQGVLGLAFDPGYATNKRFYVNYTDGAGNTRIERFTATDPELANPTGELIMTYTQPFDNHNGGWLGFGPNDGYLYISSGDGGDRNDPGNRAQDITDQPLGKILRVDVNGDDFAADPLRNYRIPTDNPFVGAAGDDEIWAYGLRNAWRPSFDRLTGDFFIADVGQNRREEINFQPAASPGGENYGWRLREGTIATPTVGGPPPPGAIEPIYDYLHGNENNEGFSVTGGYLYRGPIAALQGHYFFADFINQSLWSLRWNGSAWTFTDWLHDVGLGVAIDHGTLDSVSSFGEDNLGNLFIVDHDGDLFQIVGVPLPGTGLMLVSAIVALRRWAPRKIRPQTARSPLSFNSTRRARC